MSTNDTQDLYFHMEYPKTALINTAAVINAVKNQVSHYKTEYKQTDLVDSNASDCYSCPFYQKDGNCTRDCEKKRFQIVETRTYINEQNHFGKRAPLNTIAIKLFLYLHFLKADQNGYVRIEMQEAADVLCCSKRTILRNLDTLSRRGYISYGKGLFAGTYQAFILSVKENHKSAAQGGRGYFVLSFDMFKLLCNCKTINEIRLELRGIVSALDGLTNNQFLNETSFSDAKRMLPAYVTKKKIKQILISSEFRSMFGVKLSKENSFFYITMKEEYNPVRLKTDICKHCRSAIEQVVSSINKDIEKMNRKLKQHQPLLQLSNSDITDISKISLQLPEQVIVSAIYRFYDTYVKQGEKIHSVGAMIRTLSWDIYNYNKMMASQFENNSICIL